MKLLAFDTSTEILSVALTDGNHVWQHSGPGGAQASRTLIPTILDLLAQAGLRLDGLDALVFGRGPGSFTGLRTACSVAQGLALGTKLPVLPLDTLLAVAEEARFQYQPGADALQLTTLLDARMDEMYVQRFAWAAGAWAALDTCTLRRPEALVPCTADTLLAGNVFKVYAGRLPAWPAAQCVEALPTASAMLRLAPALLAAGHGVDAAQALPLYVRDKVALTTEERARVKARAALATPP
ncbi:MAG: tRNA (adenosine(37)-N6)-threonylcarbamoyltransferase complex dimerization subunit type 1 TsaB [Polaromonas sp.]|uniref:tRNA (adenosine(37)-N6)-threonylcarbamoyltransferase complex dimerization subunit type 1 TsaB n=1 Tax=Polaromonas sp. TaxID=1869339 RepID=UPI0027334A36|nr:tRNA (adenosine(37)-N6)-threonylcarbamoyltransferase complex dimerization subunit type 1 TsaB [Polaromonas sp.]MDP2819443.1 tRNA (adenosine(37)-N6)-threonylcarbamoyltransferase complex dimerization subunit type 1 TsaB [Polaromonas sp.]